MKKLFSILALIFFATPLVLAASNCAQRVDKNLDKSTSEKVERCLTEEPKAEYDGPVTEVILSDTYSVQFPHPKEQAPAPKQPQQKTFQKYSPTPTAMQYTRRQTYPQFRNDVMPSLNDDEAHETALQALQTQRNNSATGKSAKGSKGTKSAKPARKLPRKATAKPTKPAPAVNPQVQQARALQNDPLSTNPTQDNTVPPDFLDDGVMGPAGFGYNATDPAMQP